ncbi:MAG: SpoIIIAH-like family protein, partial [Bacilli bacterium]
MINKKSLWFLTLFSLILVLSVYYITMPSEMLLTTNGDYNKDSKVKEVVKKEGPKVSKAEVVVALRVEADTLVQKEMETLKETLTNDKATADEKNNAFEKLKVLNNKKGEEGKLEKLILEKHKFKSFVKIVGDQVTVVIASDQHD